MTVEPSSGCIVVWLAVPLRPLNAEKISYGIGLGHGVIKTQLHQVLAITGLEEDIGQRPS